MEAERKHSTASGFLKATVFVTGLSIMAVEMSAARLVAPFFGTSLIVWTNIIGLIMAALSAGYYLGGRLADKRPEWLLLYKLILGAGLGIFAVPFIATPVMSRAASGTVGLFIGSLVAVILLFVVPFTLLGMVSPFVIRLAATALEEVGNTAGSIYALSTVGSIIGTYLPALFCIPLVGTRRTILFFAAALILVGIVGLFVAARRNGKTSVSRTMAVIPLLAFILALVGPPGEVKAIVARGRTKVLERESLYNYIQVQERHVQHKDGTTRQRRFLVLNEGFAVHSVYDPEAPYFPFVGSVWDYFGLCTIPLARPEGRQVDVCIVGLAAGTISKQMYATFGKHCDLHVDGVEIDPEIIRIGREYFDMNDNGLVAVAEDGRTFLQRGNKTYDVIITDAYRQPYIPFHLTTKEYFSVKHARLKPHGIMAINVGTLSDKTELFTRIVSTVKSVFPHVYYVPVTFRGALFTNFVVIGAKEELAHLELLDPVRNELLNALSAKKSWPVTRGVLRRARNRWRVFTPPTSVELLTDDKAPVEFLTDWLILKYLLSGKAQKAMSSELGKRATSGGVLKAP